MTCCHPHLSCSTDCTCPCDECAEEQRIGEAAARRFGRAGHRARRDRAAFLTSLRAAIALGVVHE